MMIVCVAVWVVWSDNKKRNERKRKEKREQSSGGSRGTRLVSHISFNLVGYMNKVTATEQKG